MPSFTVSMSNKLFIVDGSYRNGCEVFDSVTNKFVLIENLREINSWCRGRGWAWRKFSNSEISEFSESTLNESILDTTFYERSSSASEWKFQLCAHKKVEC